jgi:GxxExxY protein
MKPQISQIAQTEKKDSFSYEIIGAAMEVHRELGPGFLEAVYQEAMEIELKEHNVPYVAQPRMKLYYKQFPLDKFYIPDFVCFDSHVLEIKAQVCLTKVDEAQMINSLKASRHRIGLLINFGQSALKYQRFVYG